MRKIILGITIILFCFLSFSFADEADRQNSDYVNNPNKVDIKTSAGEVFGVTAIATANGGWVALYDVSSASDITVSTEPKIEIAEATANNTGIKDFSEGLNFYNGIYVDGSNVKTVIYYR
jgi:hypothetical protein